MNSKINIPIMPSLNVAMTKEELCNFPSVQYVQFDLHKLIDNHRAIIEEIDKNDLKLGYGGLITLSDWLYDWYKKNNHYVLSGRILDAQRYALSCADRLRDKIR